MTSWIRTRTSSASNPTSASCKYRLRVFARRRQETAKELFRNSDTDRVTKAGRNKMGGATAMQTNCGRASPQVPLTSRDRIATRADTSARKFSMPGIPRGTGGCMDRRDFIKRGGAVAGAAAAGAAALMNPGANAAPQGNSSSNAGGANPPKAIQRPLKIGVGTQRNATTSAQLQEFVRHSVTRWVPSPRTTGRAHLLDTLGPRAVSGTR
jgi:hypothetical protein